MSQYHQEQQKKAAQASVRNMQPLIKSTSNQAFISISKSLGKDLGLSRHDVCKNIERKLGPSAAAKTYKTMK